MEIPGRFGRGFFIPGISYSIPKTDFNQAAAIRWHPATVG
jgi:hypothetical protein